MRTTNETRTIRVMLVACLAVALLAAGCASHKFVRSQDEATRADLGQEIDDVASEVEQVQGDVERLEGDLEKQGERVEAVSGTAQEALDRAVAAGKLAEGKFLYETVLSDDAVRFGFDKAALSDEARQALDSFAAQLKERDEDVYIEIQGHTDSTGSESYNLLLGEQRAEATHRYLSLEHGFALHRMGMISYGEAAPIADNSTPEGRARNRRVALVVLK
jgi:peptidoglycan-associated lipoprotein